MQLSVLQEKLNVQHELLLSKKMMLQGVNYFLLRSEWDKNEEHIKKSIQKKLEEDRNIFTQTSEKSDKDTENLPEKLRSLFKNAKFDEAVDLCFEIASSKEEWKILG